MRTPTSLAVLLLVNPFADIASASCGHGTTLLKRKVTASKRAEGEVVKKVEVGKFGYIATQGPTNWAALTPENIQCATSKKQSPIDVTNVTTTLVQPGALALTFPPVQAAEFENIGTTIEVVMEGKGASTVVDGKTFDLKQFHFHSPSEHTVDGEYFPLEMHLVHEATGESFILPSLAHGEILTAADGQIAVIAAQFQLTENGETTSLLTSVTEKIAAISSPGSVIETGALDFAPLVDVISKQALHTYEGSLTTPPCAEGLKFFVTSQQLPLDVATFNKIKAVVGFNARFTQNNVGAENLLALSSQTTIANVTAEPVKEIEGNAGRNDSGVIRVPVPGPSSPATVIAAPNEASEGNAIAPGSAEQANEIIKSLTGIDLGALGALKL